MDAETPEPETVTGKPSLEEYQIVGAINLAWATLDSNVSAAIFSILKIDPFEFLILVGRVEPEAKMAKLAQILKHRGDDRWKEIRQLKKRLDKKKPLRNAMTHGMYEGKTKRYELLWSIPPEIVESDHGPAVKLVVADGSDLAGHLNTLFETMTYLRESFGIEAMRPLWHLPLNVGRSSQASPVQGNNRSPRPRRV